MGENNQQDWLFQLISELRSDMEKVSKELNETRVLISKYNGLREQIGERDTIISELGKKVEKLEKAIEKMNNEKAGRNNFLETIRKWTPWIITVASIIYAALGRG